ncbi:MAG: hypothetical protein LUD29_04980 [Clostridia bacterium]|nr:hypothetical protein [Clostridia bacterium]
MKYYLKRIYYYAVIIISIALAVFCGVLTYNQSSDYSSRNMVYYVVGLVLCWYASLQFHECGHKLFGLFCGMDAKVQPGRIFSSAIGCEIAPRYELPNIRKSFIVTTSGGLVTNLLLLACGIVFTVLPVSALGSAYVLDVILRGLLPTSFYIFCINAVPCMYKEGRTDGLAILEAVRGDDAYKVAEAILKVQGVVNTGIELKYVGEASLMKVPQIQEDDPYFIILTELRAEYYKAIGNERKHEFYQKRYEGLVRRYMPKKAKGKEKNVRKQ